MKDIIEKAWGNRTLLNDDNIKQTIRKIIDHNEYHTFLNLLSDVLLESSIFEMV